jgi:hypothetical protein
LFDAGIELEFVRDLVLLAYVVVITNDLFSGRMEGGPIGILREGEGVESGGDVTSIVLAAVNVSMLTVG